MNKKPEHVAGEICTALKSCWMKDEDYDGYIFRFTGEHRIARDGEFILCDEGWNEISQGKVNVVIGNCEGKQWILPREPKPSNVEEHDEQNS